MNSAIGFPTEAFNEVNLQKFVDDILIKYEENVELSELPICEKKLCRVIEELKGVRIKLEPENKMSTCDRGILMPVRGGFVIKYGTIDKNQKKFSIAKVRETICHELAHIFFFDCTSRIPSPKTIPPEHICHDIARKLLLPRQLVEDIFSEKSKENLNLIDLIQQLSRTFQVALILMVKRLTEDLSILNDTMVTFWKYGSKKSELGQIEIGYKDYRRDPKLPKVLRTLLPKYWRGQVHIKAWDEVVKKVAKGETNFLSDSLYVVGKKRKGGKIKTIPFEIQCSSLYPRPNNLEFGWMNDARPSLSIMSVKKFDLNILARGKQTDLEIFP